MNFPSWRLPLFVPFKLFLQNVAQLKIYLLPLHSPLQVYCREFTLSQNVKNDHFNFCWTAKKFTRLCFARAVLSCASSTQVFSAVLHDVSVYISFFKASPLQGRKSHIVRELVSKLVIVRYVLSDSHRNESRDLSKHYDVEMTSDDDMSVYRGPVHIYDACTIALRRSWSETDGRRMVILVSSSNYMVSQSFRGNAIVVSLDLEVI